MSKQKKQTIILTIILIILAAALIVAFMTTNPKIKNELFNSSGSGSSNVKVDEEEAKKIMEEFDEYYNKEERTIIYYASTTCGWCALQTPILETIAEDYDMDYYYLDTSKISASQRRDVMNKLGIEEGTPQTIIVENKEVIDNAEGYTDPKDYIEFFKRNDMLPEDAEYSAEKYITFIDYNKYEELLSDSGTNVIVIGQTTCQHCIAFKPAMNQVARDYGVTINYLDILKLSNTEYKKFSQSLEDLGYTDKLGTPLTLIIRDGELIKNLPGERTISQLVRELKKVGLID